MRLRRGTVRFTLGWSEIDLVQARWQTRERAMICKPAWGAFVTPLMTLIWVPGCLFLLVHYLLTPILHVEREADERSAGRPAAIDSQRQQRLEASHRRLEDDLRRRLSKTEWEQFESQREEERMARLDRQTQGDQKRQAIARGLRYVHWFLLIAVSALAIYLTLRIVRLPFLKIAFARNDMEITIRYPTLLGTKKIRLPAIAVRSLTIQKKVLRFRKPPMIVTLWFLEFDALPGVIAPRLMIGEERGTRPSKRIPDHAIQFANDLAKAIEVQLA